MLSTTPKSLSKAERAVKALRMRKEGYSFQEIADALEVSLGTAYGDIREAITSIEWTMTDQAIEVREMIRQRDEEAIKGIYERVITGDLLAIDRLLKLNEQLLEMYGAKINRVDVTSGGQRINSAPIHTIEVVTPYDGQNGGNVGPTIPGQIVDENGTGQESI